MPPLLLLPQLAGAVQTVLPAKHGLVEAETAGGTVVFPLASAPVDKPIRGQHAVGGGGRGAIVWTDMCTSETAW